MNLSATSKSFYEDSTTYVLVVALVTFLSLIPIEIKASERPVTFDAVPLAYGSSQVSRLTCNFYYSRHTVAYGK